MQAIVGKTRPAARFGCSRDTRRVGGHAGDLEVPQQGIGSVGEPGRVTRFAGDLTPELCPESAEECSSDALGEHEARRQLHQQGAELAAERSDIGEELRQRLCRPDEAPCMRDLPRQLHGEPEALGNAPRPALVGRRPVRSVERRVDLHGRETLGVALQMAPGRRGTRPHAAPGCPSQRSRPSDRPASEARPRPQLRNLPCPTEFSCSGDLPRPAVRSRGWPRIVSADHACSKEHPCRTRGRRRTRR